MRSVSNPNYVKFSKTETVVVFSEDRGELRTNDAGEFFFRKMTDGRFTCASPDLERRLIDSGYRAGQQVAIACEYRNRAAIWKVRIIRPVAALPAPTNDREPAVTSRRAPIPDSKYAPDPNWTDLTEGLGASVAAAKPANGNPAKNSPSATRQAPAMATDRANGEAQHPEATTRPVIHTQMSACLKSCLCAAIDAVRDAHTYAATIGLPIKFTEPEIQDLATTLYIQNCKVQNMDRVERDRNQRSQGGGDAWRH
jgi:hypothetical protein